MNDVLRALVDEIQTIDVGKALLKRVPPLDVQNAAAQARICKICGAPSKVFDIVDLNKCAFEDFYRYGLSGVDVIYFRCQKCGFIFCDFFDDWSESDFSNLIYNADYIKVDPEYSGDRAVRLAKIVGSLLDDVKDNRILDFGSGMGYFAAEMNRLGFTDIHSFDPYSSPERPVGRFDIITCFEVLEHSVDPLKTFGEMRSFLADDGIMVFSTGLQPTDIFKIRCNWWYIAPRNGHVCAYTKESLYQIANHMGLSFHAGHLMALATETPSPISQRISQRIGPRQYSATLVAPHSTTASPNWFPVEGQSPKFRWTRAQTLSWRIDLPSPGSTRLNLEIPVIMQINPDFISGCTVHVNDRLYTFQHQNRKITVEGVDVSASVIHVVLQTPPLLSPSDLRDSGDTRALGLAISSLDEFEGVESRSGLIAAD